MILATIGTNEQPFDRLVRAVAALDVDEHLFVQYGSSTVPHGRGEWVDFLPFDELSERAAHARVVICHAGVGSIVMARRCGQRPIVMPRRHELGEAVDDHQLGLARRLHEAGVVTLVDDEAALAEAVRNPAAFGGAAPGARLPGPDALSADVRGVLAGLGVRRRGPVPPAPLSARAA